MKKRKSEWKSLTLYCRDGSASATYYFKDQSAAEIGNKSWSYLQELKPGDEEIHVRNEQVCCSRRRGDGVTKKHVQNDDTCQFNLHAVRCPPSSSTSHSPKTCQKTLGVTHFP